MHRAKANSDTAQPRGRFSEAVAIKQDGNFWFPLISVSQMLVAISSKPIRIACREKTAKAPLTGGSETKVAVIAQPALVFE